MNASTPTSRWLRLLAVLLLVLFASRGSLPAQISTEEKIHLMAEVLRARDAGELAAAKTAAARLLAVAPNDATAQRFAREIDAMIAANDTAAKTGSTDEIVRIPETASASARAAASVPLASTAGAAPSELSADPALEAEAAAAAATEARRIEALLGAISAKRQEARRLAEAGRYDDAIAILDDAMAALPINPTTQPEIAALRLDRAGDIAAREIAAQALAARSAEQEERAPAVSDTARVSTATGPSAAVTLAAASPGAGEEPGANDAEIAALTTKARAQYLAGDTDGAEEAFRRIEARDPDNAQAKAFLTRIARDRAAAGALIRERTRTELLDEVNKSWQRPGIHPELAHGSDGAATITPLAHKLDEIVLPSVSFTRVGIDKVVAALGALSEEYDSSAANPKGVNIVLLDPSNQTPAVTLTLRNTSLKRVLDFVTEAIGYRYDVQPDAVVLRPGGEVSALDTAFFPITRATVLRMTGVGAPGTDGRSGEASSRNAGAGAGASSGEAAGMKAFLQQAGVNFEEVKGANLAYDGSALIVTQTTRNLERIRNILDRYNDIRQVEIEAKFMEVQEGALDELGVQWSMANRGTKVENFSAATRSLADAFSATATGQPGSIVTRETKTLTGATTTVIDGVSTTNNDYDTIAASNTPIVNNPPTMPGGVNIGGVGGVAGLVTGVIDQFHVSAMIRALSQRQGTDLLSAPKVTVLSGNPANITVAQEMRYPQSYGQTQAQVGTGSASGGGSAGVAITAGTPQEFTMRNVGVELKVTPTVEEDDYSISLDLNPRVTEFDGFVEYGGPSIAISGGTTVNVPSGFYQPIFSVRDISTKVTIWDGATLVMGGLTREEVKKVSDKVPILGNLPLIGRAFRSKGESTQKRNLLIFVTANLVSPGGSLKKQTLTSTPANALFQNPTIVTPAGAEPRRRTEATR